MWVIRKTYGQTSHKNKLIHKKTIKWEKNHNTWGKVGVNGGNKKLLSNEGMHLFSCSEKNINM